MHTLIIFLEKEEFDKVEMEMGLMKQLKKKLKRETYTLFTLSLSTLSLLFFSYYYLASLSTILRSVLNNNNNSNNFKNSKAIFFLCNAIVVFLVKDSGLLTPSTAAAAAASDFHGEFAGKKENHHVLEKSKLVGQIIEQDLEVEEEKVMELVVVGGGEVKEEGINGVELEIVNGVEEFEEDEGVDELNRGLRSLLRR